MNSKIEKEIEFHNERYTNEVREKVWKYHIVDAECKNYFKDQVFCDVDGKKVLEIGSGKWSYSLDLAKENATVTGIDISVVAINHWKEKVKQEKISGEIEFITMDAEKLDFNDESFDIVFGQAILHHLDLQATIDRITRVLKKDGKAIFLEPLGHNIFINLYRKLTSNMRTPDEHPLLEKDLELIKKHFNSVDKIEYFNMFTLCATPFKNQGFFPKILKGLISLDKMFFSFEFFRKFAWQTVLVLSEPKK